MKYIAAAAGIALIGLFLAFNIGTGEAKKIDAEMIVYTDDACGCCDIYVDYAEGISKGVSQDLEGSVEELKDEKGIPEDLRSCHTTMVDDYFVEGHIPAEVIEKLVEEQPDIEGIAMPGMPSGSPGMPGSKTEEWVIYSVVDGEYEEFASV